MKKKNACLLTQQLHNTNNKRIILKSKQNFHFVYMLLSHRLQIICKLLVFFFFLVLYYCIISSRE